MQVPLWLTIIISLTSGLVTFAISTYFYIRHEERSQKLQVFRTLMANRHGLIVNPDPDVKRDFFRALNEAFVVFGNSPEIIECINNFSIHKNRAPDNVTILARAICKDLKINVASLKDEFFTKPYTPNY